MEKLIIDNTISAIVIKDAKFSVDFYLNGNTFGDNDRVQVKLIAGGEEVYNLKSNSKPIISSLYITTSSDSLYTVELEQSNGHPKINTLYSLQIAPVTDGVTGDFSDTVQVYFINTPTFTVYGGLSESQLLDLNTPNPDLKLKDTDSNTLYSNSDYRLRGELSFSETTETDTLSWWQFAFYNGTTKVAGTEAPIYTDLAWDYSGKKINATLNYDLSKTLKLIILYCTEKGYKGYLEYPITVEDGLSGTSDSNILSFTHRTTDSSLPQLSFEVKLKNTIQGTLEIWRAPAKVSPHYNLIYQESIMTTAKSKTEINEDDTETETIDSQTILLCDISAEPGIPYFYTLRFVPFVIEKTNPIIIAENETPVCLNAEDSFLITKDKSLQIRYDPTLTNLKRNYVDVITPTLGSAYPFVRRSGHQKYRTFTFGGLISYHANDGLTIPTDISEAILSNSLSATSLVSLGLNEYDEEAQGLLDEFTKEKIFRDKVLDFLYSDKIFLFKSAAEGNMFVRLSNISLTSNKTLGRMIYSFSATATEVMEPEAKNYVDFFSYSYADSVAYNIRVISVAGTVDNGILTVASNDEIGQEDPIPTVTIQNKTIKYWAYNNSTKEYEWVKSINKDNYTYYDEIGRVVPVDNGYFAPGYFPKTQVRDDDSTTLYVYPLKATETTYKLGGGNNT